MKYSNAFTLVELLAALTLLSILLMIAIPAGRHLLVQNRAAADVNQLLTAINYARNEAITRGEIITLCKSNDMHTCSGSWQGGQIIVNEHQQILRTFSHLSSGVKLIWNSSGKNQDTYLKFSPTGFTQGQRGSFYYCSDKQMSKTIIVADTGRTRVIALTSANYAHYCN